VPAWPHPCLEQQLQDQQQRLTKGVLAAVAAASAGRDWSITVDFMQDEDDDELPAPPSSDQRQPQAAATDKSTPSATTTSPQQQQQQKDEDDMHAAPAPATGTAAGAAAPQGDSLLAAQPNPSPAQQQPPQQQQQESEAAQKLRQLLKHKALLLRGHQAELKAQLLLEAATGGVQGFPGMIASRRRWGMPAAAAQVPQAVRERQAQRVQASSKKRVLLQGILQWHQVGYHAYGMHYECCGSPTRV
jgi:hypothetical protein